MKKNIFERSLSELIYIKTALMLFILSTTNAVAFNSENGALNKADKLYYLHLNLHGAYNIYLKESKKGNITATAHVALIHAKGTYKVPKNIEKAKKWQAQANEPLLKRAALNDSNAQFLLGKMFRIIDKDYTLALKWFKKSANNGHSRAQNALGNMYYYGRGTKENLTKAKDWFEKSAKQGDYLGQTNLGYIYRHGEGVKINKKNR